MNNPLLVFRKKKDPYFEIALSQETLFLKMRAFSLEMQGNVRKCAHFNLGKCMHFHLICIKCAHFHENARISKYLYPPG